MTTYERWKILINKCTRKIRKNDFRVEIKLTEIKVNIKMHKISLKVEDLKQNNMKQWSHEKKKKKTSRRVITN